MNPQSRVLVVDDDARIRQTLGSILSTRRYQVDFASSGEEALEIAMLSPPDLVILDLTLPDQRGFDVCRALREWLTAPILVLSVRDDSKDKIEALDLGADDYLCKPFVAGELLARVRALLRRTALRAGSEPVLKIRDLEIDLARRRLTRAGLEIRLTRTEFDILALLARNADCVVTTRTILQEVWGPEYLDDRMTLRVHIGNLRRKIELDRAAPRYVATEPGVGYVMSTRG